MTKILLAAPGPAPQNRASVAFRWVLAIPAVLVVGFLAYAAVAAMIIGWFGVLLTGRLPRFAADFLPGYLRWFARVHGYAYLLLTDKYPPFTGADRADYPIRVRAELGTPNRLAVLLRLVLFLPAWLLVVLASLGLCPIIVFIGWPVTLIKGTMPAPLHQLATAVLRYTVRFCGYLFMPGPAYPTGLFGDKPGSADNWPLVLTARAKPLLAATLAAGLLAAAGVVIAGAVAVASVHNTISGRDASSQLNSVYAAETRTAAAIDQAAARCAGKLACLTALAAAQSGSLNRFAAEVRDLS